MDEKTAKALDGMRRAIAKQQGVDESEVKMTVNCRTKEVPDYFYEPDDDFDDDDECQCNVIGCPECDERYYEDYDCGMGADGQCGKAGSEECDWECPYGR